VPGFQPGDQQRQAGREPGQLVEMTGAESLEASGASPGEVQSDGALIGGVRSTDDQSRGLGSIRELHGTVVAQHHRLREVADRRTTTVRVAANREEQLVLSRRQPSRPRLLLTPVQEPAELRPEAQQLLVLGIAEGTHHRAIVAGPHRTGPA
jgi:hypothetical protein